MTSEQIVKAKNDLFDKASEMARADGKEGRFNLGEVWPYYTDEMKTKYEELWCRDMIISCVCYSTEYNFYDEKQKKFGEYGLRYAEKLGDKRALEIFYDQKEFMKNHATIHTAVGTDCEGVSYNSITWDI